MSQDHNYNVLLVDDDQSLITVLQDFLISQGFKVDAHASAESARKSLYSRHFDLLIIDWDLPGGASGIDLCREYREQGGLAPIILVTGHTDLDDQEYGLDCGADDYITKPFQLRDLHARMRTCLRRSNNYTAKAIEKAFNENSITSGLLINDRYRLEERIGAGGMALVWRAFDVTMERTVVVKIMHDALKTDQEHIKRFDQECRLMARIRHPNVVTIFDSGTLDGVIPYMVMEFVKGESLRHLIDERGAAPVKTAAAIMTQVCAGLQDAHDVGVVHRDLKPDNIVIQDRTHKIDTVKLVDFGIARLIDSKERMTKTGTVIGTMEYISPEQLRDEAIDGRADIYALGIVLFEILTADLPLKARTVEGLVAQHLIGVPKAPSEKRNDIEKDSLIDRIVLKCLQKQPEHRYQNTKELSSELEKLL